MNGQEWASRIVDHVIRHWNDIEDRETTIEQGILLLTSNAMTTWPYLSNALLGKDVPDEIVAFIRGIVSRLRENQITEIARTKAVETFIDNVLNGETSGLLHQVILCT